MYCIMLRPHKKILIYHIRPRLNFWPHRIFFISFFIYLFPYENKVYGFVFVVVMNYKFKKKKDLSGVLG